MYDYSITGMGHNGFMNQIMQSQQDTDILIKDFENAIAAGYNPNEVRDDIFAKRNLSENDLTYNDKQRLIRKVEAIWQEAQKGGINNEL